MRYRGLQFWHQWSILELRISSISYSVSPSMSTRVDRVCTWLGVLFDVAGSSCETWKTGWMDFIESESWSVIKWVAAYVMIVKGTGFLSVSLLGSLVVYKYLALTKVWSLILKSGARVHLASMGPWYHSYAVVISSWRNWWRESRSMEYSQAH